MLKKKWWKSRTLWVMFLAFIGSIVTGVTGTNWFDGDMQVATLSLVGMFFRIVTNSGLW